MDSCWICFQEEGELFQPCKCPRPVHRKCLASWQLYSAGTREEVECRFCSSKLPDWRSALRPICAVKAPVVAVVYEGQEYRFRVEPTAEGRARFMKEVEAMLGHPLELHEVRFYCRGPTGNNLQLRGLESLDAAVYCAATTAADRAAYVEGLMNAAAATSHAALVAAGYTQQGGNPGSSVREGDGRRAHAFRQQQMQMLLPPGMDILRYWATMRGVDLHTPDNRRASSGSMHDIDSSLDDSHTEQTGHSSDSHRSSSSSGESSNHMPEWQPAGSRITRTAGMTAAQRFSEMAAAWAYLSAEAAIDATAQVHLVQRPATPSRAIDQQVAAAEVTRERDALVGATAGPAAGQAGGPAVQRPGLTGPEDAADNPTHSSQQQMRELRANDTNNESPAARRCFNSWLHRVVGSWLERASTKMGSNRAQLRAV